MPDLFLVDPLQDESLSAHGSMRDQPTLLCFPYSENQAGLIFPSNQTTPRSLSIFSILLTAFIKHPWHFNLLFQPDTIPGPSLLYLLSTNFWQTNIRILSEAIEKLSFHDIPHPQGSDLSTKLHDKRRELAQLKKVVSQTVRYVPKHVIDYFSQHSYYSGYAGWKARSTPIEQLNEMLVRAAELEKFLMESFQLLMATMSVLESQKGLEQTTRINRLTQLAFIYIPLSFVTGIFGMNIRELTGTGPHIWSFFATLVVVGILTAVVFIYLILRSHKTVQRSKDKEKGEVL